MRLRNNERKIVGLANVVIILFVPIAVFALILPINEYKDQGISGAVDCDGPSLVMLFVLPSILGFLFAVSFYVSCIAKSGKRYLWVPLVLSLMMLAAVSKRAIAVYQERSMPAYLETCGEKW